MQESLTLSNPPDSPEAISANGGSAPLSLEQLAFQVHALRGAVQLQQTELQALQQQEQAQPLVGWITDSPWGLAIEGLVLGMVALGLGAASMWGFRAAPQRKVPLPAAKTTPPAFSDSMLYLADQDDAQGEPLAVSAQLHDPRYDNRGKMFAQDDDDAELDYYRMALTHQGLSVTAGAGQVDSARIPLDEGVTGADTPPSEAVHSVFASPPSAVDFDQRAAAEEVERVRRYLAQRRADRANPKAPPAPLADAPRMPESWEAMAASTPLVSGELPMRQEVEPPADVIEHTGLAEGASLLAALTEPIVEPHMAFPPEDATAQLPASSSNLLEWEAPSEPQDLPAPPVCDPVPEERVIDGLEHDLPMAAVQLQLAVEFRDLGLWDEARERVLEVLAGPDGGHHAQAHALLEELAQTAPAPVVVEPQVIDPWASPHTD